MIKGKAKGKGAFEEEDRSRDWYCPSCKERNFMKRPACFKCGLLKPKEGDLSAPPKPTQPPTGTVLNGMVKSYNRKGFGFIMCLSVENCQDIYYTRENLSPQLQTRDIPGQHVSFEVSRYSDGKLTAKNIRPVGEEMPPPGGSNGSSINDGKGLGGYFGGFSKGGRDDEDRTRDWACGKCGERNFVKRFECYKCKTTRPDGDGAGPAAKAPPPPRRTFSPHAGARAIRESLIAVKGGLGRKRSRSNSNSSSSSSSHPKKKKTKSKAKRKKKSRSRSSSNSSSSASRSASKSVEKEVTNDATDAGVIAANVDESLEKAKAEALEKLMMLQKVEPKEQRMSDFRALLRQWHPDKNPDRVEMATAVFQFLQKGKLMLD